MRRESRGGGCTVAARYQVNPGDPLRARATLLLGSGGSAHLYIFSHFHTLRARAYMCARQADVQRRDWLGVRQIFVPTLAV